ncbi:MoaD/ThiS family protein [Helicobacter cappadocius]|uniref:MoaD/ThiS family protein n=1 Tax=Helicobacter cappadocius TaxID=3063998 RepID=A0AA90TFC2_9HELI|nr:MULTISPECIES: MoaD/ThiS family protein [unclassified Helicobacter]MDO7253552.1 MoaD/ThiS family protein [Helicobacter sp. faydin-H75]MDP2539480.1 MoaD/ThiS family protein [Helicobacter sp. faydin-H76]
MISVEFLGPIGENKMELDVKNLTELKEKLQGIESIKKWLPMSALAINDVLVEDINTPLKDGDKVVILPPVCGG